MKVTLKDIAESTGYSVSTVSRVLANSDKISSKAKGEILEVARKLHYPLIRIRNYDRKNDILNVALVCDFHEGQFYASYLYGYFAAAKKENINLSVLNIFDPRDTAHSFLKDLIDDGYYDGVIILLPELEKKDYTQIIESIPDDFPIVSNALIDNPSLATFTFDGYSAGYQAAEHFYTSGFKNVGIVKGPGFKSETRFRYNGFNDFISTHDDMNLLWEFEGNYQFEDGVHAFSELKKAGKKLDAVFVSNDSMAFGFINAAKADGIRIPEDLAVMGYDNLPTCEHIQPTITSVNTDFVKLGSMSIKALKNMIEHKQENNLGMLSMVPVQLEKRESTKVS